MLSCINEPIVCTSLCSISLGDLYLGAVICGCYLFYPILESDSNTVDFASLTNVSCTVITTGSDFRIQTWKVSEQLSRRKHSS
jgi:hypothetical protein